MKNNQFAMSTEQNDIFCLIVLSAVVFLQDCVSAGKTASASVVIALRCSSVERCFISVGTTDL